MDLFTSALRSLRAHPGFSALILLLLALGIGANTAIFSVVHSVLLKPLPYPEPGELVLARKLAAGSSTLQLPGGGDMMPDNEFLHWTEAQPKSFRALAAYRSSAATLARGDGAIRVTGAAVTGEFFPLLGVSAWRGRLFNADDLKPGAAPVTVLSHREWQARFNGDLGAIGQLVKLDEVPHTIIGVLPPAFEFTEPAQYWRPLAIAPSAPGQLRIQMVRVLGRLFPGATLEKAQLELDELSGRFWDNLASSFGVPPPGAPAGPVAPPPAGASIATAPRPTPGPDGPPGIRLPFADTRAQLVTLQEQLVRQSRATLWLLLTAVGFVLLIACANIANLQLARAAGRRRESAIRAALGATPARLAAELLLENLILSVGGAALGVLLAWWGTQGLQGWLADYLPRLNPIEISAPVLSFAVGLALVGGLAFGVAPAWAGSRVDLLETLKEGGQQSSPASHRWRQALVALEVALALVLTINTGLLVKSIQQLYANDLGYRTSDVLTANLALPRRYATPAQQSDFATRWLAALQALPGVRSAALTDAPPLSNYNQMVLAVTRGGNRDASVSAAPTTMSVASITPEFFRATGIALRDGRFFTEQDGTGAPAVAIVNEAYVKKYLPDGLTPGSTVNLPSGAGVSRGTPLPSALIVGVVADIRPRGFESTAQPMAYFPLAQQPRARLSAVLQFVGDSAPLGLAVTAATHKVDADLALDTPQTLEEQIARQTASRRITLWLTAAFAATAVGLAALGIFGVMSYTVTQRTAEIGVRMALGADTGTILRWMLRYGLGAIVAGLAAGLALTFATGKLVASLLTGVTALDPWVIAAGVASLTLTALAACVWPAWRASQVNPVTALRSE